MVSLASTLAGLGQRWAVVLRIEGVGLALSGAELTDAGGDARVRFCSVRPDYAAAEPSTLWRRLLVSIPEILSERADPLGGDLELGGLTFELLDEDDFLTQTLRTERAPLTAVSVAISTSATAIQILSTTGIAADDLIWIGAECLRVISVDSGTGLTVTRAHCSTRAAAHDIGDRVCLSTPILETRRVLLQFIPIDADSSADAVQLDSYVIDGIEWDEDVNVWRFTCRTQGPYLARSLPYEPASFQVYAIDERTTPPKISGRRIDSHSALTEGGFFTDARTYLRRGDGGEVVGIDLGTERETDFRPTVRDVADSGQEEWRLGDVYHRVYVAGDSFRYSPAPSPSNSWSTGTWVRTSHWVDLLLTILTSSHDRDDGLASLLGTISNYNASYGNWAVLPPGFGAGVPHTQIDWLAALELKQRTLDYLLPNFVFGHRTESVAELLEREFLKPMGAYLTTAGGLARLVMPRAPLAGSSSVVIGTADILAREVGPGLLSPRWQVRRGSGSIVSDVIYLLGQGEPSRAVLNDAGYRDTFGQGAFAGSGPTVEIPVPGARRTDKAPWARRGVSRLWRAHRPRLEATGDLNLNAETWAWGVGDLASVTVPELPNMRDATRGWSEVLAQLLERAVVGEVDRDLEGGEGAGAYLQVRAQVYGGEVRVGRIAPSAVCDGGGGFLWTFEANRYTEADAVGGLPTRDVEAFAIGDIVTLVNSDGSPNGAAGTETIVDIDGPTNTIELTGDFNGELGIGSLMVFVGAGSAAAQQLAEFAWIGGRTSQQVAGSGDPIWVYGEV